MNIEQKKVYDTLYEKIVNSTKGLSELGYQIGKIKHCSVDVYDIQGRLFDIHPYGIVARSEWNISSEGAECVSQIQLAMREMKNYLDKIGRV